MSATTTTEKTSIEAAWKREALNRCRAYDEGRLSARDAADVFNDAYSKLKSAATVLKIRNARAGRPCH